MDRGDIHHAWLIIAHNEFGTLQHLISALDSSESDIYVHIDKKVTVLPELRVEKSHLVVLCERVDVRWGSVSQIQCELALLKAAVVNGPYDYYHIISGTTLPLKGMPEINRYFEAKAGSSICTGLCKDLPYQETLKVRRYNLFLRNYASRNGFLKSASQFLWKSAIAIQRILGIEANRSKEFYKASNWLSLTEEATQYLLSREKEILKIYRYSFCGDEYFAPSELMASPYKDRMISDDHYLRHNIARSNASVFHLAEYNELCKTDYLFARKFTES
ncbi:MAG: glycosyl transferase [Bacteroidales bacterium]|nr:glycosyl transferase [Bacteroidales bacterium]